MAASFVVVDAIEDVYVRRYAGFRRGVAALVGGSLAQDAVQEGFARALRRRNQFRGEGSVDAWVWRIVVRAAQDMRRERGADDPAWPEAEGSGFESDPELVQALRQLPPRRRLVVFLRYFADLSYPEIAEACAISEGTVAATLAQARAEIRDLLEAGEVTR